MFWRWMGAGWIVSWPNDHAFLSFLHSRPFDMAALLGDGNADSPRVRVLPNLVK